MSYKPIFDIDGTIFLDDKPLDGAVELINSLKDKGETPLFVTNTTSKTITQFYNLFKKYGLDIEPKYIVTPIVVVKNYLKKQNIKKVMVIYSKEIEKELFEYKIVDYDPEIIVLADDGSGLTYDQLNKVVQYGLKGVEIITLQKNRYYVKNGNYVADLGFYIGGFEYVLEKSIKNFGKPSIEIFQYCASILSCKISDMVIFGDDIEFDILSAQNLGLKGILVKTGKYIENIEDRYSEKPTLIIDSVSKIDFSKL